jgi:hypothetical protein
MSNTNTQTETSAVQDARDAIFNSIATHNLLKEIIELCETRDVVDAVNNLQVALNFMKMKLKEGNS